MKTLKDAEAATPGQLKDMTPPQVDELFAAVWDADEALRAGIHPAWDALHRAVGDKKRPYETSWGMPHPEVKVLAEKAAAQDPESAAAKGLAALESIHDRRAQLRDGVQSKLEAEFKRRGRWSRIYLVTDGHAHRTSECSTCHNGEFRTPMQWMIEWSGKSDAEIIEAIADRACTVCYPDAPVNRGGKVSSSALFTDEERDRDKERAERAVAKAKRTADKAAKAICAEDGGPLKVYTWTKKAHQERRRGQLIDIPERVFYETIPTLYQARAWITDRFDRDNGVHRDLDKVADAIAHKEGKTRDQVIEEAKTRAKKRK